MEEQVYEALREAMDDEEMEIQPSDKFRDYESWDSLAHLSMVAILDEKFGIEIEGNTFQDLITVEDLIKEIEQRTA